MIRSFLFSTFFFGGVLIISLIFLPSFFFPQKIALFGGKIMGYWTGICLRFFFFLISIFFFMIGFISFLNIEFCEKIKTGTRRAKNNIFFMAVNLTIKLTKNFKKKSRGIFYIFFIGFQMAPLFLAIFF